jgi:hypothetical protein
MHPGVDGGICATIINLRIIMIFIYIFVAVIVTIVVAVSVLYWGRE